MAVSSHGTRAQLNRRDSLAGGTVALPMTLRQQTSLVISGTELGSEGKVAGQYLSNTAEFLKMILRLVWLFY